MRRFKKLGLAVVAMAMAFSMAACGNGSKDNATATDATKEEKTYPEATVIEDTEDWTTTEEPVVENERFTTVEGADVMGFDFEDGSVGPFTTYVNGGAYELYVEDGELVCDISKTGSVEHGCQVYYDGFTMAKGCVYTMHFDIRSDVERTVQWRVQINGGDYHLYAGDYVKIGPETQTIDYEFTMEEDSDPSPRFVINMGAMDEDGELPAHKIYIDNVSLFVTDSSNAEKIEGAPTPIQVKVNQVGYLPEDKKTVVVTSEDDDEFKIVKADTGETVYIGQYGDMIFDKAVVLKCKQGDFSDFQSPGTYKIISRPSGASYEFTIGTDIYDDVYKDLVLMLYKQRCGSDLDESIAGDFAHEACHMGEAVVYGDESTKVDVSGGWHDAGDYGRYVVSGAKTVADLLLAYEDYGYDNDAIGIPESGNGTPDLLDEARYELEWMLKMQNDEGGVYHKVTCAVFPETVLAVDETDKLILAPVSFTATADFAAVMAKASVLYADYDADFAAECLEASKKAYEFVLANDGMKGYSNPDDIVTGEYHDNQTNDERLWAATELYLATKEDSYLEDVKADLADTLVYGLGWAAITDFPLYDLAKADGIDETIKQQAKDQIIKLADDHVNVCKTEAFETGLGSKYEWGSNMTVANNIQLLLMANNLSPNEDYITYAQKHRDYIFGVNGVGYCYVTGYGTNSPQSTHHRPSQVLGETMSGMLVGGANPNGDDPYSTAVLYGMAPALSYVDNEQSYSCNEVTIYWNSPLIYGLTGLLYNN